MILPPGLMAAFREKLGFYSCTVPSFEQYTLERFLSRGYFEKHINRMRKSYKALRNRVIGVLQSCPHADKLTILEQDAGLHFLLKVDTPLSDSALTGQLEKAGIRVRALSSYYHGSVPAEDSHCLVIDYSGLTDADLDTLETTLAQL